VATSRTTNSKSALSSLSVYDGADFVGTIVEDRAVQFRAFDSAGKSIGIYETQQKAMRAIPGVTS
jgi:hypothetical protein